MKTIVQALASKERVFHFVALLLASACTPAPTPTSRPQALALRPVATIPEPSQASPAPLRGPCTVKGMSTDEGPAVWVQAWTKAPEKSVPAALRCRDDDVLALGEVAILRLVDDGKTVLFANAEGIHTIDLAILERATFAPPGPVTVVATGRGDRLVLVGDGHDQMFKPIDPPSDGEQTEVTMLGLPKIGVSGQLRFPGRLASVTPRGPEHVVVVVAEPDDEANWYEHLRVVEIAEPKVIIDHQASASSMHRTRVTISPDNQWVGTADLVELVKIQHVATGAWHTLVQVSPARHPTLGPIRWTPPLFDGSDRFCVLDTSTGDARVYDLPAVRRVAAPKDAQLVCLPRPGAGEFDALHEQPDETTIVALPHLGGFKPLPNLASLFDRDPHRRSIVLRADARQLAAVYARPLTVGGGRSHGLSEPHEVVLVLFDLRTQAVVKEEPLGTLEAVDGTVCVDVDYSDSGAEVLVDGGLFRVAVPRP